MIFLSFNDLISGIKDKIFPDPKALLVQLIATFILFLIVKHFLYKPAKEFIRKRQEYVANQINEAKQKNSEADIKLDEAKKIHQNNIKESDELIKESRMQAKKEREIILNDTKKEAERLRNKVEKEIELERANAQKEIKDEMIDLSIEMSKQILKREVNKDDEKSNLEELLNEVNNDD